MNDPLLGLVIALISTIATWTGYRFGHRAGQQSALIKLGLSKARSAKAISTAKRSPSPGGGGLNGFPHIKASWLRRNWFKQEDPQQSFTFFRS
jgi:hypothetical protein